MYKLSNLINVVDIDIYQILYLMIILDVFQHHHKVDNYMYQWLSRAQLKGVARVQN